MRNRTPKSPDDTKPESLEDVLARWKERGMLSGAGDLEAAEVPRRGERRPTKRPPAKPAAEPSPTPRAADSISPEKTPGRYDFDIAEFPMFRLAKGGLTKKQRMDAMVYQDTIRGKDGADVAREWKVYPGAFGFGGSSAQELLYTLIQLYVEQGCRGSQIRFGTLRSLYRRMHPDAQPGAQEQNRLRRDLDILRGYDIHCRNAFWDREKRAYVDMHWRLFNEVFYFKPRHDSRQEELPFGFVEASRVLQEIARTRGFFALGFDDRLFYSLKPLEQRLGVYLAKRFLFERKHKRFVDELARALPIEANREDNVRMVLKRTAEGLLAKELPILAGYRFEKSLAGRWLVAFDRAKRPRDDKRSVRQAAENLSPMVGVLVDDIVAAIGNDDDRPWWEICADRLGRELVYQGLSQLKDVRSAQVVKNPGGMLTKIYKDLAEQHGRSLPRSRTVH